MNSRQIQTAIDKYLGVIVENGTRLQQYQPAFYEKLTSVTAKLMAIQAERAGIFDKPNTSTQKII